MPRCGAPGKASEAPAQLLSHSSSSPMLYFSLLGNPRSSHLSRDSQVGISDASNSFFALTRPLFTCHRMLHCRPLWFLLPAVPFCSSPQLGFKCQGAIFLPCSLNSFQRRHTHNLNPFRSVRTSSPPTRCAFLCGLAHICFLRPTKMH